MCREVIRRAYMRDLSGLAFLGRVSACGYASARSVWCMELKQLTSYRLPYGGLGGSLCRVSAQIGFRQTRDCLKSGAGGFVGKCSRFFETEVFCESVFR